MTFPLQALIELGEIQTGSTPLTSEASYWNGDVPFVTPSELDRSSPVVEAPRTLSEAGALQSRLLQAGSVMVCCIGSLGKIGIAGRTVVTNQQINSIEFDQRKIWPKYGFYACQRLKPTLVSMAPATTIPIVSKSKFGQLQIPVPPLPEQRRIAAILDQADALRAKRREALAQLDSLTQSIFIEMFGAKNEYPVSSLADFCELITDGTHQTPEYADEGVIFLSAKNVTSGYIDWDKIKFIPESLHLELHRRLAPRMNDILLAKNGTTGVAAIVDRDCTFDIYVSLALLRAKQGVLPEFLLGAINSPICKQKFNDSLKGVGVPNLHLKEIRSTQIPHPPLNIQHEFLSRITALEKLKVSQRTSLAELNTLFASLQHRAFAGEL